MRKSRAFTLIELLVVIAIIALLATLVINRLQVAKVKANDSKAKSDISAGGTAIETFRNDDSNILQQVIGNTTTTAGTVNTPVADTLTSANASFTASTNAGIQNIFTGVLKTSALTYGAKMTKTGSASSTYTYKVVKSGQPAGRQLVSLTGSDCYVLYTDGLSTPATTGTQKNYFFYRNGVSGTLNASTSPPTCP